MGESNENILTAIADAQSLTINKILNGFHTVKEETYSNNIYGMEIQDNAVDLIRTLKDSNVFCYIESADNSMICPINDLDCLRIHKKMWQIDE